MEFLAVIVGCVIGWFGHEIWADYQARKAEAKKVWSPLNKVRR